MSTNCVRCVVNKRTSFDLLCDTCRELAAKEQQPKPMTKYSYSTNEEGFNGEYDKPEDAALDGFSENPEAKIIFVGENREIVPENHIDANDVIEQIACQDDFIGDHVDDSWPSASKEQMAELTDGLQALVRGWVKKHDLAPSWYSIGDVTYWINTTEGIVQIPKDKVKAVLEDME